MSFKLAGSIYDISLPTIRKFVLITIAQYANHEGGSCFPSQAALSLDTCLSERRLREHIHALAEEGWLTILSIGNGRGQRTQYQLNVDRIQAASRKAEIKADDTAPFAERRTIAQLKADAVAAKGGRPTSDDPLVDPSKDPSLFSVPTEPPAPPVSDKSVSLPKPTKVTEGFISLIHGEYDPQIGPQQVSDTISYWLGHQGFRMQADKQAFLWKKMGEQADRLRSNGRPQVSYNPVASDAYMLPEVRTTPKAARS